MSFQDIKRIEKSQTYLDIAIRRGLKKKSQGHKRLDLKKGQHESLMSINMMNDNLSSKLDEIIKNFPHMDNLNEFYSELLKVTLDYSELKKALGSVSWARKKIAEVARDCKKNIREARSFERLDKIKSGFIGRVSSIMRKISEPLQELEKARQAMYDYPVLKTDLFTVCIAGFPNVGKTTLLSKLTTSTPDIQAYAFTTKQLNLGYAEMKGQKIQFIDTPGTLARPEKMNNIEKQAYLAIKYVADLVVYIFDLTEPYPLEDQKKLLEIIRQFRKQIIIYLSKTDILENNKVEEFCKEMPAITDIAELKKEITNRIE
ncbi:50S ribosome-binding GTPase [Candidatus Woesearchaeota archaeon]|nr:50S ribosome-binding GTPase [Candidatus Woesearchaeota archaeon]